MGKVVYDKVRISLHMADKNPRLITMMMSVMMEYSPYVSNSNIYILCSLRDFHSNTLGFEECVLFLKNFIKQYEPENTDGFFVNYKTRMEEYMKLAIIHIALNEKNEFIQSMHQIIKYSILITNCKDNIFSRLHHELFSNSTKNVKIATNIAKKQDEFNARYSELESLFFKGMK